MTSIRKQVFGETDQVKAFQIIDNSSLVVSSKNALKSKWRKRNNCQIYRANLTEAITHQNETKQNETKQNETKQFETQLELLIQHEHILVGQLEEVRNMISLLKQNDKKHPPQKISIEINYS